MPTPAIGTTGTAGPIPAPHGSMSMASRLSVFLCSRMEELRVERGAALEAIRHMALDGLPIDAVLAEDFPAQAGSPRTACLAAVRASDAVVVIVGLTYSEPIAEEVAEARASGRPCLLFVREGVREPAAEAWVSSLTGWTAGVYANRFTSADDLKYRLSRAIRAHPGWYSLRYLSALADDHATFPNPIDPGSPRIRTGLLPLRLRPREAHVRAKRTDDEDRGDGEARDRAEDVRESSLEGLAEATRLASTVVLVGDSGSGKTTGLRSFCHDSAMTALGQLRRCDSPPSVVSPRFPIYVDLSREATSLLALVGAELSRYGHPGDEVAVRNLLRCTSIDLLMDGFDRCLRKGSIVRSLEDVRAAARDLRVVITTQPAHAVPIDSAAVFDVVEMTFDDMRSLFVFVLGPVRGEALLHTIKDRGMTGAFRKPILAWFAIAALEGRDLTGEVVFPAGIYRRVLVDRLVGRAARREDDGSLIGDPRRAGLSRGLAAFAAVLVRAGLSEMDTSEAEGILNVASRTHTEAPELRTSLLPLALGSSILTMRDDRVCFSHPSYRDFFAALWLQDQASFRHVRRLAREQEWHAAIIFLCGLLAEAEVKTLLSPIIRRRTWIHRTFRSFQLAPDPLYFLLDCLVTAPAASEALKDLLINGLPLEPLRFRTNKPWDYHTFERSQRDLCSRIGRLRTGGALRYLRSGACMPEFAIFGFAHLVPDVAVVELVECLLACGKGGRLSPWRVGELLAALPPHASIDSLLRTLRALTITDQGRVLDNLRFGLSMLGPRYAKRRVGLRPWRRHSALKEYLIETSLNADDRYARREALGVLVELTGKHKLPWEVECVFLEALRSGSEEQRFRAASACIFEARRPITAAAIALRDSSLMVRLAGLEMTLYHDTAVFPHRLADVVAPLLGLASVDAVIDAIPELDSETRARLDAHERKEQLVLGAGATQLAMGLLRTWCCRALGMLCPGDVANLMRSILLKDQDADVCAEALRVLAAGLGPGALPDIRTALTDPRAEMREAATHCVYRHESLRASELLETIKEIWRFDASDQARTNAQLALAEMTGEEWGYERRVREGCSRSKRE